ncbi:hypothetical protein TREPR_1592 [Treponema primitia ZAS-2]|uniref:Uncharacterized protein n=1 Tax=Treponema primitia (strain ATCC BAA-887 / DSM 12427 / ZAS-2) TaxID=545694 RepID=F5YNU5_TREPZ|nr:hypothetical protein TREPR_1592 [Treponema primitia ZAS-2]
MRFRTGRAEEYFQKNTKKIKKGLALILKGWYCVPRPLKKGCSL